MMTSQLVTEQLGSRGLAWFGVRLCRLLNERCSKPARLCDEVDVEARILFDQPLLELIGKRPGV